MAELRFQSRPWILLPDRATTSSASSRTIVVAKMRQPKSTDKSMQLKKPSKNEHHVWRRRDSANSFQKAMHLVQIVTQLPNEKEVIYSALDKWVAFDSEFPVIAVAKSLEILKKRNNWLRIIQVCKWLFNKGQIITWSTYDTLLFAFNMEGRIDEAESLYNKIVRDYTRSTPKRIFSRVISIYDNHSLPEKILEVFADMEEFNIHPDGDTTWRIGRAFVKTGQPEKVNLLLKKYMTKWKYIYFDGTRVRVRRGGASDPFHMLKIK